MFEWKKPDWYDPQPCECVAEAGEWRYELWKYGSVWDVRAIRRTVQQKRYVESFFNDDDAKEWCESHYRDWYNALPKPTEGTQ
jgi:hypothetical protein